jgi:hypothetical protein
LWHLFQVGRVPLAKQLGQTKHSTHKEVVLSERKQASSTSRKSSSGNVNEGAEGKKGLLVIILYFITLEILCLKIDEILM